MAFGADSGGNSKDFDPNTEASAPGLLYGFNDASGAVSEVDRNSRALIAKLLELGRNGDTAQSVGYRGVSPNGPERKIIIQRKQHEDELRLAMRIVMTELDERIAQFDARLAELDAKLKEIDEKLAAVDELEELYERGDFDPNNPAHRALLERAGIKPEDWEKDPLLALSLARHHWNDERDYWKRQRDDVVQKREEGEALRERAESAATPEQVHAVAKDFAKLREDGGAVVSDKATADMTDHAVAARIDEASGFNERDRADAQDAFAGKNSMGAKFGYGQ